MNRLFALLLVTALCGNAAQKPVRIAIAGLVHDHVDGFLRLAKAHPEIEVAGVFDPDPSLHAKYSQKYSLPKEIFYTDLNKMLSAVKPDVVTTFTSTFDHPAIVEACAAKKLPVMMEKPLAVSMEHARRIQHAVSQSGIPLIVNYETTWYASHGAMRSLLKEQKDAGAIRKMVAMDGHNGPKEIGVSAEFFNWLTDPAKNGAGALFDFGCYGANLMTWMMDDARPVSVSAVTRRFKPQTYPRVDDEADITLEYSGAVGLIEGSWNWPFGRKDFEVYTDKAYAIASGGNSLRTRLPDKKEMEQMPAALPDRDRDSIGYLVSVVRDGRKVEGLSSLANNMIVVEILSAARESARTGRKVVLR